MEIELSRTADEGEIEEVRPLWEALREHHASVSSYVSLNLNAAQAWDLRRRWYLRVLEDDGIIVKARGETGLIGYAVVSIEWGPDDTFDVGSGVAEIISLAVAGDVRGTGVGSSLMRRIEEWATERGVDSLRVAVMSGNDRAVDFYEQQHFEPAEQVLYRRLPTGGLTDDHRCAATTRPGGRPSAAS